MKSKEVHAYREEKNVSPQSTVDNIRRGKILRRQLALEGCTFLCALQEIPALKKRPSIPSSLNRPRIMLFLQKLPKHGGPTAYDQYTATDGYTPSLPGKRTRPHMSLQPVDMIFSYADAYGDENNRRLTKRCWRMLSKAMQRYSSACRPGGSCLEDH
jgi:hypothetical protein